jgi:hypothetical protein
MDFISKRFSKRSKENSSAPVKSELEASMHSLAEDMEEITPALLMHRSIKPVDAWGLISLLEQKDARLVRAVDAALSLFPEEHYKALYDEIRSLRGCAKELLKELRIIAKS